MKTYIYIITAILVGALGYNLYMVDYSAGFSAEENFPMVIGIGSSICGLILALVFFGFFKLQNNIKKVA
ncbi:hypothetical protein [Faecalibacter rhinopitheci]|uniref:Uncharacterized protein n=1 Tax=Faecalibacter rhinopitheci TaxID=2779678 RepID=A0A8J7FS38_9FLAO|nr:hypothetical protein [Faecalibacter rhinopitheci]MBF0597658.1 hypothetical protein [Faecalibacter rhinopitheci]MBQ0148935.1 hypothetical protein [Candidatus Onthonaster equi]